MPNVFENTALVATTALDHFENNLILSKLADRQWEKKFGIDGAKVGDQIDLRRHFNPAIRTGNTFTASAITDRLRRLTIDTPLGVDYEITNADMALDFDKAEERYFAPAGRRLANEVDLRLGRLARRVANFVGAYNTAPSVLADFSVAVARLDDFGVPDEDRYFILNPTTMDAALVATSTLTNDEKTIGRQYVKGKVRRALNADWHSSQNIEVHTSGVGGGTPAVNGVPAEGATTLATDGWTASVTDIVREGDIFTLAGINAVNPITGEDLGFLRQFVVIANASSNASGQVTLSIDPEFRSTADTGFRTVTALPADNALLTFVTTLGSVVARSPIYCHKNWAALCIAPQPEESGVGAKMKMVSDPDGGGIGIRYAFWWDGNANTWKIRFDILIGMIAQMPEFCLRLGAA